MKTTLFNLLFSGLLISGIALSGCSKSETISDLNNGPKKTTLTSENDDTPMPHVSLLNQNLGVSYALDGGVDITRQFEPYTFKFAGTEPSGQAYAWNSQTMQTGSWTLLKDSDDFAIMYPVNVFPELAFFNRHWTIGASSSAVIRLVAADGDEIQLSTK
ncbi:MAG TPA: hypothetical protein VHL77_00295 [Ferruginibacter sp.]|nr:hypothetical protein [Ferruginibacter sp.]